MKIEDNEKIKLAYYGGVIESIEAFTDELKADIQQNKESVFESVDTCLLFIDMLAKQVVSDAVLTLSSFELGKNYLKEKGKELDIRTCPCCGQEVNRENMRHTKDCHGIPFRLVCIDCYEKLMEKGYDGEYYTEDDEHIDGDY